MSIQHIPLVHLHWLIYDPTGGLSGLHKQESSHSLRCAVFGINLPILSSAMEKRHVTSCN